MAVPTRSGGDTLVLGLAALWLLAGCGGGGGGSQADAGSKPATSAPGGSSGAPAAPATPAPRADLQIAAIPAEQVLVGAIYSLQPQVSHAQGEVKFSIANAPDWAEFDVATGRLVGVPQSRHVGSTRQIIITVRDQQRQVSLPPFDITVMPRAAAIELPAQAPVEETVPGRVVLSWQVPTVTEDDALLVDLEGYRVHHGMDAEAMVHAIDLQGSGSNRLVIDDLQAGRHYFAVRAVRANGVTSALSNIITRQVK